MTYLIDTNDGLQALPDCFEPDLDLCTKMPGMDWIRVFSACQVLMSPSNLYRVTHKRARQVIKDILGFCPKGKPGTPREGSKFRDGGKEAIYDWLGVKAIVHHRADSRAIDNKDCTFVFFAVDPTA